MLYAHIMVNAVVASFEKGPKTFNSICMGHFTDVFTYMVFHSLMVVSPLAKIGAMGVGKNYGAFFNCLADNTV